MDDAVRVMTVEKLQVRVYTDRRALGRASGEAAATKMKELLSSRKSVAVIFAAADSQKEFLETLAGAPGIDWRRVTAYHMDEYIGLAVGDPRSLGRWLKDRFYDQVKPGRVHYLDGMNDPERECRRYADLLKAEPADITALGIGENGHLAFNEPPVADFKDPKFVKVIDVDLVSRQQQVNEGCFDAVDRVPKTAYTLTVPALLAAPWIHCMVPGTRKAAAVKKTLEDPISTACPATILRRQPQTVLYLDQESARLTDTALAGR